MQLARGIVIICPECKVRQTGYVEFANDNPFIKCSFSRCGFQITGHTLGDVTTTTVRWPSDLRGHNLKR